MKYLIFRNHTVEHLFKDLDATYSGYGDLLHPTDEAESMIWFYMPLPQADSNSLAQEVDSYQRQVQWLISNNENKQLYVFLLSSRIIANWINTDRDAHNAIIAFNETVILAAETNSLVKYIDIEDYINSYSDREIFNWKYYLISQMILSPEHAKPFNQWLNIKLRALNNERKKCLILDLDNTLWGGVVGEDELSGIELGDAYPGLAFRVFQENLIEMSQKGVILAICSKNNLQDVEEVWSQHPFMVLKKDHISSMRINWNNKASNILEIAQELNIGLDSIVFIDDNPAERELVSVNLPEVTVPLFPEMPYELPDFISQIKRQYFQVYELTSEDISKTDQYKANAKRSRIKATFISNEDYLESLDMELMFMKANKFNIPRIAQMTQKTNQFNLTTKRYNPQEIESFIRDEHLVYCLNVKDKYGDNGITAAAIIICDDNKADIDTLLLSCRIIGRGIENQFVQHILNKLFCRGITSISSTYNPTIKNAQVEKFYDSLGFDLNRSNSNGMKEYSYMINGTKELSDYYRLRDESD